MTTATDPARDARRAELRQRYVTWLRADVETLKRDRAATFRRLVPGCSAGVAVILLVGAALFAPGWPPGWWTDPWSLARIGVAIGGTWWFARKFFVFTPDADDRAMTSQDIRLDGLVRRWAAQVRPGATYEPSERLDGKWSHVASLVDGEASHGTGLFRWDQDGVTVRVVEGSVVQAARKADGTKDEDAVDFRFRGWVAVATVPRVRKAAVRVRARGSQDAETWDAERLRPATIPALAQWYDVRATDPAVAARVLARAAPILSARARLGQQVHVGIAGKLIVVLLEDSDTWTYRLHPRFGESHALLLGETLDLMHDLIAAIDADHDE